MGKCNTLFSDGHVEACEPSRLRACLKGSRNASGSLNPGVNYGITVNMKVFTF
ncbi:MAG: hypothetical protein NC926_03490 [Candidatus Omnitrophica bacterium]|nr:hypothetical protein [Candidatus Omnitrophota bacterium]MCM8807008.1 hypothetical protein [Candidatus Omnitrophota bacterium]